MLTFGSKAVNDQLVSTPMSSWYYPGNAIGPVMKTSGNTYPSTIPNGIAGSGAYSVADGGASGSSAFDFFHSPILFLVAALVVGMLALRFIHYA